MTTAVALLLALFVQASAPPPVSPDAKAKAQSLLRAGTELYDRGDVTGALETFEAAYAAFPSTKLQFNIGQANRALGRPVEALTAFEKFLSEPKDSPAALVDEARRAATDLAAKLGRLRVDCSTSGADATLDGRPIGSTPLTVSLWVTPGRHQLTLRGNGFVPAIIDLAIASGETQVVERTLLPSAISSQPTPTPVLEQSPSSPGPSGRTIWSRQRWYFWTSAGGAVLFSAGAIAAGLSANSRYNGFQGSCGQTTAGCTQSQIDSVTSRATLANVFWGLAAASAVAAGVSFYIDSRGESVSLAMRF